MNLDRYKNCPLCEAPLYGPCGIQDGVRIPRIMDHLLLCEHAVITMWLTSPTTWRCACGMQCGTLMMLTHLRQVGDLANHYAECRLVGLEPDK